MHRLLALCGVLPLSGWLRNPVMQRLLTVLWGSNPLASNSLTAQIQSLHSDGQHLQLASLFAPQLWRRSLHAVYPTKQQEPHVSAGKSVLAWNSSHAEAANHQVGFHSVCQQAKQGI